MKIEDIEIGKLYKINVADYKKYFMDALLIPENFTNKSEDASYEIIFNGYNHINFWDVHTQYSNLLENNNNIMILDHIKINLYYGIAHSHISETTTMLKCLYETNIVYIDQCLITTGIL